MEHVDSIKQRIWFPFAELLFIAALFYAFVFAAFVSPVSMKGDASAILIWVAAATVFFLIALFGTVLTRKGHGFLPGKIWIVPIVAGLITAVARLPFLFDDPLYWDSSFFYNSIDQAVRYFDFSLTTFFQYFKMADHTAYGYSSLLAIAQFLFPNTIASVNFTNLVLESTTITFLAKFFIDAAPNKPKWLAAFLAVLVGFTPILYGMYGTVNLDRPLACILILTFCLAHERRFILMGFALLMAVGTKEPALFFVGAFVVVQLLATFVKAPKPDKFASFLKDPCLWCLLGTVVLLILIVMVVIKYQGQNFIWGGLNGLLNPASSPGISSFRYDPSSIVSFIKMAAILNFQWVFVCIIVGGLIFELIRHSWSKGVIGILGKHPELLAYLAGICLYYLFSLAYVTVANPRYLVFIHLAIVLMAALVVLSDISFVAIEAAVGAVLVVLCLLESFATVDPLTLRVFTNVGKVEGVQVSCSPESINSRPDACVYNHQVMAYGEAVDQVLDKTDYDGTFEYALPINPGGSHIMYGLGGWSNGDVYLYQWDPVGRKRVNAFIDDDAISVKYNFLQGWCDAHFKDGLSEKVVVVSSDFFEEDPQNEAACIARIEEKYNLEDSGSAGYGAWELDYRTYVLK